GLDDASNAVVNIAAVVQVVLVVAVMCDAVVFRLQQRNEILDVMQPSSLRSSAAKQRPMLVPQRLGDKKQSDQTFADLLSMSAPTSVSDQQKQLQRIVGLLCEKQRKRRRKEATL
ncbi:transmembrane protein, putative, partial [Bodo saltans]